MLNLEYSSFPVLTTERLVLRRLIAQDALLLHHIRSDEDVNRYVDRNPSTCIDDALAFISKIDTVITKRQGMYWVITLAGEDVLIGTLCFWNFDLEQNTIELGYELLPAQQGKGIMAEAVARVIKYGFTQLNANAITAFPSANNAASVRLLQKLGFIIDGALQTEVHAGADNMLPYILHRHTHLPK